MTIGDLTRRAAPSNILDFMHPKREAEASYDRALARQEAKPREALAKVQALRHERSETMQPARGGGEHRARIVRRAEGRGVSRRWPDTATA